MRQAEKRLKELGARLEQEKEDWMKDKSFEEMRLVKDDDRPYASTAHDLSVAVLCNDVLRRFSNIPKKFSDCRFNNFDFSSNSDKKDIVEQYEWIQSDENFLSYPEGVMFMGSVGTGKTHLAVATMKAFITCQKKWSRFICQLDLNHIARTIFKDYEAEGRYEMLKKAPHILLDDFGEGHMTDIVKEYTVALVKHRIDNDLRTDITTNFGWKELGGMFDRRLMDRIKGACRVVSLVGDTYRKKVL